MNHINPIVTFCFFALAGITLAYLLEGAGILLDKWIANAPVSFALWIILAITLAAPFAAYLYLGWAAVGPLHYCSLTPCNG